MSCYLAAATGLNRIPTSFMDRHTQQDISAELEEEIQCITLLTVNQSLSGLQVSLFLSVLLSRCFVFTSVHPLSVCDQHTVSLKLTLILTNNWLCTFMLPQRKKCIDCGDLVIFPLSPASRQTFCFPPYWVILHTGLGGFPCFLLSLYCFPFINSSDSIKTPKRDILLKLFLYCNEYFYFGY